MKVTSPRFLVLLAIMSAWAVHDARAQANLVTNPQFAGANPLTGWRIAFPWEAMYKENDQVVKVVPSPGSGGNCVLLDLPVAVATNQGGKIESDFLKLEPGANYHVQIESYSEGLGAKCYAEVWAVNPKPTTPPTKYEVPAQNGLPAMVTVYRAQLPDPAPGNGSWKIMARDFSVPAKVRVAGQETQPSYITIKAIGYGGGAGKIYFRNIQLLYKGKSTSGH